MSVCKSTGPKKWGGNEGVEIAIRNTLSLLVVHRHLLLVLCVATSHSHTTESNLSGVVRIFGCVFSCTVQRKWCRFQQPPPLMSHPRLPLLHRVTPDHHPNSWYGRHFPVCQWAEAEWRPAGCNRVQALSPDMSSGLRSTQFLCFDSCSGPFSGEPTSRWAERKTRQHLFPVSAVPYQGFDLLRKWN